MHLKSYILLPFNVATTGSGDPNNFHLCFAPFPVNWLIILLAEGSVMINNEAGSKNNEKLNKSNSWHSDKLIANIASG